MSTTSTAVASLAGTDDRLVFDDARRRRGRVVAEAALIGLVVGLLVVAPWMRSGYLLLLDWVSGPDSAVTPGLYGLAGDELDAMPWRLAVLSLREVVGPAVTAWLLVLLYFPVAAAGAARLVGGGRVRGWTAAVAMTCNPVVVDRIAVGHVPYLIGVAVLPWLVAAARRDKAQHRWFGARTAGLFALGIAVSPHLAWIGGLALLVVAVVPRPAWRDAARLALTAVAALAVYGYGVLVYLSGVRVLAVTEADLAAYATRPEGLGLVPTVLSLEGFWREGGSRVARPVAGPLRRRARATTPPRGSWPAADGGPAERGAGTGYRSTKTAHIVKGS